MSIIATDNPSSIETTASLYRRFLLNRAGAVHVAANLALDAHETEVATHLLAIEAELRQEAEHPQSHID